MLPTLFDKIVGLASSRAPQFVSGLVLCGTISFVVSDFRLGAWSFLGQRLMLIALLWPVIRVPLAFTSVIAAIAIALIFTIDAWHLWYIQRSRRKAIVKPATSNPSLSQFSLRCLAAALGLLVSYGIVQKYHGYSLPFLLALTITWLFISSLLNILLPEHALHASIGILNFAEGCRILYALWQPTSWVWGLWTACDVLIALSASHLYRAGVSSKLTEGQR